MPDDAPVTIAARAAISFLPSTLRDERARRAGRE